MDGYFGDPTSGLSQAVASNGAGLGLSPGTASNAPSWGLGGGGVGSGIGSLLGAMPGMQPGMQPGGVGPALPGASGYPALQAALTALGGGAVGPAARTAGQVPLQAQPSLLSGLYQGQGQGGLSPQAMMAMLLAGGIT